MEPLIHNFLKAIGEDPNREGLKKTPRRFEEALRFLTSGYQENIEEVVNGALYPVEPSQSSGHGAGPTESGDLVLIKNIEFYALCEHHLLPFFGKAHIGYLPGKTVIGLSKVSRIVDMYARRLQTQERLGEQICDALEQVLKPRGVGIFIEAQHLCMRMRGVKKENTTIITTHFRGALKNNEKARREFLTVLSPDWRSVGSCGSQRWSHTIKGKERS